MNNNQKATKRALLTSVMALVMCVVMLVGTTFAWFTDTASTGVNKIVAGNLKVDIVGETSDTHINGLSFQNKDDSAQILWEPGCRYLTEGFRIANKGNLALKWKAQVNKGTTAANEGNFDLLDVIDFYLVTKAADGTETETALDEFTGNLKKTEISDVYYIKGVMKTTAGNDYQGLELSGITITVYATQDTVENDSFNNQYDKDATYLTYPAGVTEDSFAGATSVEYTDNLGNVVTSNKPAVAAYVDASGNVKYVGDIYAAIKGNASVIYCKKDATLRMRERLVDTNRTPDLTSDLTIYANGADFQYGQISMNMTDAGKAANVTVKVYDAKNIEVWGMTPNDGVTQNIVMENCTNIGTSATGDSGILMYITGNTGTVNATVNNCHVEKNSSGIYMSTNGSLTVTNSTFTECATGIKSSYKGNGTRTDRIENCVFTKCGCTAEMAGSTAWLKDDSAAYKYKNGGTGTITLTTKGNTITGTIGEKGDTQIGNGVTVVEE
jgi:predicted ribosomally synthesized peptide with SipW-like signal peptide